LSPVYSSSRAFQNRKGFASRLVRPKRFIWRQVAQLTKGSVIGFYRKQQLGRSATNAGFEPYAADYVVGFRR
jgi:hypothetical protein